MSMDGPLRTHMTYYLKGKDNQRRNTTNKTTIDKRIVARKVIDELNRRIDSNTGLQDVETVHLIKFLQAVIPKDAQTVDHNINFINSTPRPTLCNTIPSNVIDITPKPSDSTVDKVDNSV
jgi:hypothetical protein